MWYRLSKTDLESVQTDLIQASERDFDNEFPELKNYVYVQKIGVYSWVKAGCVDHNGNRKYPPTERELALWQDAFGSKPKLSDEDFMIKLQEEINVQSI